MGKGAYSFSTTARRERPKRAAAERVSDLREIYEPFDAQAIREQASRCVGCGIPGCEPACPLGNRASVWMQLAADGDFEAAARHVYRTNAMPWATGRLCPAERLCEGGCVLREGYGSATTQETERFLADACFDEIAAEIRAAIVPNHVRVAVVGSGPAGLACADFLSRLGYAVTVFEKSAEPGGILAHGLTAFKLERTWLPRYLRTLEARGVELRCGTAFGDLAGDWRAQGYRALFVGVGTEKRLEIPGMEAGSARNVVAAADHLAAAAAGSSRPVEIRGKRTLVLGGGDVALDCARLAVRQGASEVVCAFRESERLRPGSPRELALALEEGVRIVDEVTPVRFVAAAAGGVSGVELISVCCRPDAQEGGLEFSLRPGTERTLGADVVIVSLGFVPEPPGFVREAGIETDARGRIVVDREQQTSEPGIFAGGDAVRAPSLVAFGLRDGREAAFGIDRARRAHAL